MKIENCRNFHLFVDFHEFLETFINFKRFFQIFGKKYISIFLKKSDKLV